MKNPQLAAIKPAEITERTISALDIERVLEVSAELFAKFGFDGVSMREISRESGCATPSIYYHFTSKANLYDEVFAHKIDQTIDIISERLRGKTDKHGRFRELVEAFFDMFTGDRVLFLLMQRDVTDAAVKSRRLLSRKQYDHFTSLIRRLSLDLGGGALDDESAFTIGALIFGYCGLSTAVHEIYDQGNLETVRLEKERLVAAVMKLLGVG